MAPRSAIAAQLTTEVAVWNGTKGGYSQQNWRKSQSTSSGNPAQCWSCKSGLLLFFRLLLVFLGLMRCESYNANKFKHHVSCVLPASHVRISPQFKLQQERVKTCNPKPNTFFKKLFKGYWRCPALLAQNHPTRPETGKKRKTYQNQTLPIKSSLEENEGNMGEIRGNMKG